MQRKSSKRLLVHSDEDEDEIPTRIKRARTDASDDDDDMDVDSQRSLSTTDDSRFLPDDRKRMKPSVVKKRFHSDDEENSVEDDLNDLSSDEDVGLDAPPRRGAPKVKAGATKGKKARLRGTKVKDKEKEREILIKDERKLAVPPTTTSRASSTATQSQPLDLFPNEDPVPFSEPLAEPAKDPLNQSIPKKRKFPPIKKTKTATGTTGTSTPTGATQKPPPPPVQELAKPSLPTSEQRKQALTGVRDIDLGDSKIYAELFKGAGGNTPRSGLKNAEERRKELDKMRDEARAKRVEEAKFMFDLQCQADKIGHFEQRLRGENSTVLHPNFLAAKFRDEWEVDRRNRRASPKEEGEA